MYPQQYPSVPSAPTQYGTDFPSNYESMPNYHTSSEERMADFQQVVGRYESVCFSLLIFFLMNIF